MKKIISAMLVLALMSYSASAQSDNKDGRPDRGDRRQSSNRINPRLLDQLNLTTTQAEQVKVINEDYRAKMQEMIKSDLPVEDRKAKRNTYDAERRTKVLAILTPAQVQKLQQLQKAQPSEADVDYKRKTKDENGDKTKVKVKTESD